MIISGLRKHTIYSEIDHSIECPHCHDHEFGIELEIYRRHLHTFWIPTLPFKKRLRMKCLHCGKKIKMKDLRDTVQIRLRNLKGKHRGPIWQYSGLFAFLGFIIFMVVLVQSSNRAKEERLRNPQVGDYLCYNTLVDGFSSYYVESVSEDSLVMRPLITSTYYSIDTHTIEKPENHSDSLIYWSKADLWREIDKNIIVSVSDF